MCVCSNCLNFELADNQLANRTKDFWKFVSKAVCLALSSSLWRQAGNMRHFWPLQLGDMLNHLQGYWSSQRIVMYIYLDWYCTPFTWTGPLRNRAQFSEGIPPIDIVWPGSWRRSTSDSLRENMRKYFGTRADQLFLQTCYKESLPPGNFAMVSSEHCMTTIQDIQGKFCSIITQQKCPHTHEASVPPVQNISKSSCQAIAPLAWFKYLVATRSGILSSVLEDLWVTLKKASIAPMDDWACQWSDGILKLHLQTIIYIYHI